MSSLASTVSSLAGKLDTAANDILNNAANIGSLRTDLGTLNKVVISESNRAKNAERANAASIAGLASDRDVINGKISGLASDRDALKSRVSVVEGKLANGGGSSVDVSTLQSAVDDLQQTIPQLATNVKVDGVSVKVAGIDAAVKSLTGRVSVAEGKSTANQKDLTNKATVEQVNAVDSARKLLAAVVSSHSTSIATTSKAVNTLSTTITGLATKASVESVSSGLSTLSTKVNGIASSLSALSTTVNGKAASSALTTTNNNLNKEIARASATESVISKVSNAVAALVLQSNDGGFIFDSCSQYLFAVISPLPRNASGLACLPTRQQSIPSQINAAIATVKSNKCPNPSASYVSVSSAYSDLNDLWTGAYVRTTCSKEICPSNSRWWIKYWTGIGGTYPSNLQSHSNYIYNRYQYLYPYTATGQYVAARTNFGSNYGAELKGYFKAPVTG